MTCRAQVLVTHEAPSCHAYGWQAIDNLAVRLGVSYVFHGHLHETRIYPRQGTCQVVGVGYRGIVSLETDDSISVIRAGDYDATGGLNEQEVESE